MFDKIKASYYLVKGTNKLAENNDIEALEYFNKAKSFESEYDIYIHKGYAEFNLYEFDSCIISYQFALQMIKDNKKLNIDEKNYLRCYVLKDLIDAFNRLKLFNKIEEYHQMYKDSIYDRKNISNRLLRNFPMTEK